MIPWYALDSRINKSKCAYFGEIRIREGFEDLKHPTAKIIQREMKYPSGFSSNGK